MAAASSRLQFTGTPELAAVVDGDTWLTPRYILDHLGKFDLDPCAASGNPEWCAQNFYTKTVDGLSIDWYGRVFMNPPFSNTAPWIRRHAEHGNGISLVPASVESRVWREIVWKQAHAILLLHGRTRFANPDGSATTGRPLRSIALIAWSSFDARILEDSPFAGVLLKSWNQR
jgi:phage N-6-adenine-methyltransferase